MLHAGRKVGAVSLVSVSTVAVAYLVSKEGFCPADLFSWTIWKSLASPVSFPPSFEYKDFGKGRG